MSTQTATPFSDRAAAEIDALHRVMQAWFRAEGEAEPMLIMSHFDQAYSMFGAAGAVLNYEKLQGALTGMWGARPTLVMTITDVIVRHVEGSSAVVTYKERQDQESGSNERWSTALLLDRPDHATPLWLHLQETFCA